jgi:hypothetical protein
MIRKIQALLNFAPKITLKEKEKGAAAKNLRYASIASNDIKHENIDE